MQPLWRVSRSVWPVHFSPGPCPCMARGRDTSQLQQRAHFQLLEKGSDQPVRIFNSEGYQGRIELYWWWSRSSSGSWATWHQPRSWRFYSPGNPCWYRRRSWYFLINSAARARLFVTSKKADRYRIFLHRYGAYEASFHCCWFPVRDHHHNEPAPKAPWQWYGKLSWSLPSHWG